MRETGKIEVRNPVRIENGIKTKWYEDKLKTAEEGEENHVQK